MGHAQPTFDVDKKGLAQILARRGIEFAVLELVQNALDEQVTIVTVAITKVAQRLWSIRVEDDNPDGFHDLRHAYTLFADSRKKANPEQRGRFNLGEKLVIACCKQARIYTTTGGVSFDEHSGRHMLRTKRERGSEFQGTLVMTNEEAARCIAAVKTVLVPPGVTVNLVAEDDVIVLLSREPVRQFDATLATEMSDAEGMLRRTERKTTVQLFLPHPGERATLYELGIPVVELADDSWHVNVQQKVPLNVDRDNVTPAYLRRIRTLVLNEMHEALERDQAVSRWVGDALASPDVADAAVESTITARYGDKRVVRDPSDPEGTKLAVSLGYALIEPGSFSGDQWDNIKRAGAALPASRVTPSSTFLLNQTGDGPPIRMMDDRDVTKQMLRHATFARELLEAMLDVPVSVEFANDIRLPAGATWCARTLTYNVGRLGRAYFDGDPAREDHLRLLIHEGAHHYASDHLSSQYHEACCRLGARLARLVVKRPSLLTGA